MVVSFYDTLFGRASSSEVGECKPYTVCTAVSKGQVKRIQDNVSFYDRPKRKKGVSFYDAPLILSFLEEGQIILDQLMKLL